MGFIESPEWAEYKAANPGTAPRLLWSPFLISMGHVCDFQPEHTGFMGSAIPKWVLRCRECGTEAPRLTLPF